MQNPADHRQQWITDPSNRTATVTTVASCEMSPDWPWGGEDAESEDLQRR